MTNQSADAPVCELVGIVAGGVVREEGPGNELDVDTIVFVHFDNIDDFTRGRLMIEIILNPIIIASLTSVF